MPAVPTDTQVQTVVEVEEAGEIPAPSLPAGPTPLPLKKILALLIVLMNEGLSSTLLLPFIGFYVAHLLNVTKEEAGYTSGILVSVFMVGQFLSGKALGRWSDVYGRRPVMLFSLLASGVFIILFGLSSNFYLALVIRFAHGLVNGNIGIAKAVIGEITDRTNESKGFAVINFGWGCGCLVGPFFGGVLYDPVGSSLYPDGDPDSFLGRFPALLPCLAAGLYAFVAFLISLKVFPETNHRARPLKEMFQSTATGPAEDAGQSSATLTKATPSIGYRQVFTDTGMRTATLMYVSLCAVDFGWNEVFPLWAIASTARGGMALSSATVGELSLVGGFAFMGANVVFPTMLQKSGDRLQFWQWSVLMWAAVTMAIPLAPSFFNPASALAVIVLLQLARVTFQSWASGTVYLFILGVAEREHLGVVNSIAQSCGCIARAIVPVVLTPLFALSIDHPHPRFLFNYITSFALLSLVLVMGFIGSRTMRHVEAKLRERKKNEGPAIVMTTAAANDGGAGAPLQTSAEIP